MNSLLYKSGGLRTSPSLLALNEWQEKEKQSLNCAVDEEGCLLDNLTLELRVHPPEVHIDNSGDPHSTLVTIDSANRPGSLVFVSTNPDLKSVAQFYFARLFFNSVIYHFPTLFLLRWCNILPSLAFASIAHVSRAMEAGSMTVSDWGGG